MRFLCCALNSQSIILNWYYLQFAKRSNNITKLMWQLVDMLLCNHFWVSICCVCMPLHVSLFLSVYVCHCIYVVGKGWRPLPCNVLNQWRGTACAEVHAGIDGTKVSEELYTAAARLIRRSTLPFQTRHQVANSARVSNQQRITRHTQDSVTVAIPRYVGSRRL